MVDKRSKSQAAADERYEAKRASASARFGGRCSVEEKQLLTRLSEAEAISEKEIIFKALKYFENNR